MSETVHSPGLDYCSNHHGVRDVDEERCDFAAHCLACTGSGDTYDEVGNVSGDCPECADGWSPCRLYPLFYVEQAS